MIGENTQETWLLEGVKAELQGWAGRRNPIKNIGWEAIQAGYGIAAKHQEP